MTEDSYEEGQDMMDIDFSELNPGRGGRGSRFEKKPTNPEKWKKMLKFGAALLCVLILIVLIILFAGDHSEKEPATPIQGRVEALEEKIARFGGIEDKITELQGQQKTVQKSIARLEGSLKSLRRNLRNVTREVEQLKKAGYLRRKTAGRSRRRYHIVQKGDSPYKIAVQYGITVADLNRLNNLTKKSIIYPGQKLLIGPVGKR